MVMEHENVHGAPNIASNNDVNNQDNPGTPIVANSTPQGSDHECDDQESDANETPTLNKINDDGMGTVSRMMEILMTPVEMALVTQSPRQFRQIPAS